jgi:hypothetical protein
MNIKEKARIYDAQQLVDKFNQLYPIGSKVMVKRNSTKNCPLEEVTVKSEAFLSYSNAPVCFFNEISGYFSIDKKFIKYPKE